MKQPGPFVVARQLISYHALEIYTFKVWRIGKGVCIWVYQFNQVINDFLHFGMLEVAIIKLKVTPLSG